MYRKTYAEINLDNIESNVKIIKDNYPDYKYYFAVVKGNAYGHGYGIIKSLIDVGINYLAAATLDECLIIREINPDIPILCLQPVHIDEIIIASNNNITITITNHDFFKKAKNIQLNKAIKIHIKLDVGMNRLGIKNQKALEDLVQDIKNTNSFLLEGIFTHFSMSGFNDDIYKQQVQNFRYLLKNIDKETIAIIHAFRSAVLIRQPKIDFCNGVRLGIILYGYNQNITLPNNFKSKIKKILKGNPTYLPGDSLSLKPAFNLYSEIIEIKEVQTGEYIGYGNSFQAKENMKIGIIAIGYADGLDKTTGANVLINNKKYPLIGLPCMDMVAVQIDDNVKLYDKVTLIGKDIEIKEINCYLNTTCYTLLNKITNRVPRIYTKNGEKINDK